MLGVSAYSFKAFMSERCNKCRVSFRTGGDTWCIGCSAWETIGLELCGRWSGPAGYRRIADDVALSAARHIRALRALSAGPGLAPAAGGAGRVKQEPEVEERKKEKGAPGLAAKAKTVDPESEYEYTYTEEEVEEEGTSRATGSKPVDPRPALTRKVGSESLRRGDIPGGPQLAEIKEEKDFEEQRTVRERSPSRRKEKRSRSEGKDKSKSKRKDKKEEKKKRKKRRGGRKHQQLSRLREDPFRPVHRKLGSQAVGDQGSLELHH